MTVSDADVRSIDSDDRLAERASAGDGHAFAVLVARYQARVYRLACRLTSETEAPDVLQDVFLQVHRHLPSFRRDAKFSTWLYRIATNACLMRRRASVRRPAESLEEFLPAFEADGSHRGTPEQLRVAANIGDVLDRRVLAARAREAVDRLPDLYREAFVLRDLEEMSTAEVAEALEIDPAAVRQRVHRARLMLRGFLSDLAGGRR